MNEAVPSNEAAVVNVLPAADRNNRSSTNTRIMESAANGTKTQKIAPIAEVTPPIKANRPFPRIGWVLTILAPTQRKNANVSIAKVMRPKIVKRASNVGARVNFGVKSAVSPDLFSNSTCGWARRLRIGSPLFTNEPEILTFVINNKIVFVNFEVYSSPVTAVYDTGASVC